MDGIEGEALTGLTAYGSLTPHGNLKPGKTIFGSTAMEQ